MSDQGVDQFDELKRRARRRFIGAIVLALVAAALLPLILENQPNPGVDAQRVDVVTPDGRRVVAQKPLPPETAQPEPVTPSVAAPVPEAKGLASTTKPEAAVSAPEAPPVVPEKPKLVKPPKPALDEVKKPVETAKKPVAESGEKVDANVKYVVQLASYPVPDAAHELRGKLRAEGFANAYVRVMEKPKSGNATETKASRKKFYVRVGPFKTKAEAERAQTKLKAKGHAGSVLGVN